MITQSPLFSFFSKYSSIALVAGVGIAISTALFFLVQENQQKQIQNEFEYDAQERFQTVTHGFATALNAIKSLRAFYLGSQHVERDEFHVFAESLIAGSPMIQALAWVPRVTHANRSAYEAKARQYLPNFTFTEDVSQNPAIVAKHRNEYLPIYYAEPFGGNESLLGYDLMSNPALLRVLNNVRDHGNLAVTEPIVTLPQTGKTPVLLIIEPVYKNNSKNYSVMERRQNIEGFAVGVFHMKTLIKESIRYLAHVRGIKFWIRDISADAAPKILYSHYCNLHSSAAKMYQYPPDLNSITHFSKKFKIADRTLMFTAIPSSQFTRHSVTLLDHLSIFIVGLLVTAMLTLHLYNLKLNLIRRKDTNIRLNQAYSELGMFRHFIENAGQGMWMANLDRTIIYANSTLISIFGESDLQVIRGTNLISYYPESMRQQLQDEILPTVMQQGHWTGELELLTTKGVCKPTIENIFLIRNENGEPLYLANIITDITEQKRQEMKLANTTIAAQAANAAKSNFLAMMSHEVRTPMNAAMGMAQLMLATRLTNKQHHFVQTIITACESLVGIFEDILGFSKIEAEKLVIEIKQFNLQTVVNGVMNEFRKDTDKKGIVLNANFSDGVPEILFGDSARLQQVLAKILSNSVKFTQKGHIDIRVTVNTGDTTDDKLCLDFKIQDTGIGISDDAKATIFNPFTQQDSASSRIHGGTGLGLTIAKRLIAIMGGSIQIESEIGKGFTCYFNVCFKKADM